MSSLHQCCFLTALAGAASCPLAAQSVAIDTAAAGRQQTIDGFGTCISSAEGQQTWWQEMYLDDLGASILRLDLVPRFKSPWSDLNYHSPWFLGSGNQPYAFNFEITTANTPRYYVGSPGNPNASEFTNGHYNGPEGTRARTYTNATDYGKTFGNRQAPIAVMGPNIDDNIARCFNLAAEHTVTAGAIVAAAKTRDPSLARFKLIGSIWSPAPWLKLSSNTVTSANAWPLQPAGVPYPHIWAGNFVGGRLDVSETPIDAFDDSALPADSTGPNVGAARGPTSALTQFARGTAAYLRALQNQFGARFYAISIQNELNFETFFNSCSYPLSAQYITALKYVRAELDKYPDLRAIKIMGPEDLLSDSTYSLWQYGGGATTVHKNLQYLQSIASNPAAAAALSYFCIHGYAADGVASPGANPAGWERWANGWTSSPAAALPATVKGFRDYAKKSWMTETSGENTAWGTVSSNGAFSLAVKIHQALTTGQQNAWVYWQATDGNAVGSYTLTDATQRAGAAKFTALRHFSRYLRPGAVRVVSAVSGTGSSTLLASAYLHEADRTLTVVLVNTDSSTANVTIPVPSSLTGITNFTRVTSRNGAFWQTDQAAVSNGAATTAVPASGIVTLFGTADAAASVASRIVNLSARGRVGVDDSILIAGFVLGGSPAKSILVRAVGPGLEPFDVAGFLTDPQMRLMQNSTPLTQNDNWNNDAAVIAVGADVSAFPLEPMSADAALVSSTLSGGVNYTALVNGANQTTGVALAELYDSDPSTGARLINISARCGVGTGDDILIAGFVIGGSGPQRALIRGIGPTLTAFNLTTVLPDPKIELYRITGSAATLQAVNDDWGGGAELADAFVSTGAFALPGDSKDAALLVWLDPGNYTAQVSGVGGATGIALAEIYEVQ